MRRLGWPHGWVRTYECRLFDPLGQRRVANPVDGPTGNGGFVRVKRKPTGHSKFTGGRRYRRFSGKDPNPQSIRDDKFKHDQEKLWYQEAADLGIIFYQAEEEEAPAVEAEFNIELQEARLQIMPCNNLLEEEAGALDGVDLCDDKYP